MHSHPGRGIAVEGERVGRRKRRIKTIQVWWIRCFSTCFRCDSSRHEVWQYSICELFLTRAKYVTVVLLNCPTYLSLLRNLSEDGEVGLVSLGTALEDCDKVRVCIRVHLLPVHL